MNSFSVFFQRTAIPLGLYRAVFVMLFTLPVVLCFAAPWSTREMIPATLIIVMIGAGAWYYQVRTVKSVVRDAEENVGVWKVQLNGETLGMLPNTGFSEMRLCALLDRKNHILQTKAVIKGVLRGIWMFLLFAPVALFWIAVAIVVCNGDYVTQQMVAEAWSNLQSASPAAAASVHILREAAGELLRAVSCLGLLSMYIPMSSLLKNFRDNGMDVFSDAVAADIKRHFGKTSDGALTAVRTTPDGVPMVFGKDKRIQEYKF